ncbi:S8 family peptidase [Microlunatus sp. GCM10028923]|uniref:S8 family peptidase n=1 Tax=Microlunatus sp. GCM10028923 TaxID=3273400 RepID=UPI00360ACD90
MRRFLKGFAALAAVILLSYAAAAPAAAREPEDNRLGRYIVVLDDEADLLGSTLHRLQSFTGLKIGHVFEKGLRGYSATMPNRLVKKLLADPQVKYVEPDQEVVGNGQLFPWGINRVQADLSYTKAGNGSGTVTGVNAYVIDSGVAPHVDLNVVKRLNFTEEADTDCHGHGTHISGTIAARDNSAGVVGVAPGIPITSLKVLDCETHGWYSDIIAAINWITANAKKPAVANLSFGGSLSKSLEDAIRRSVASGVFYGVSAGNKQTSACNQSPARAGAGTNNGIVTVAAIGSGDREASFSNYGPCVDLWAPGVDIKSTGNSGGIGPMSGTSMAAPHVTGAAALYLSRRPTAKPADVEAWLKRAAVYPGTKSKDGRAIRLVCVKAVV